MPNVQGVIIARKLLPIIYVLDTSGSMKGDRISAVNEAMHDVVDLLKDVADSEPSADIKMGVLTFASKTEWKTNGLISPDNFFWNDLAAGGLTSIGAALTELNKKLSRKEWLKSDVGFKAPVIIFMSDGGPTDDYLHELKKIEAENKWYKVATKICIAVGDDADMDVLKRISGFEEAIIKVNQSEALKQLIKVVSVTVSKIGSKSHVTGNSLGEILAGVKGSMNGDDIEMTDSVSNNYHYGTDNNTDDTDDSGWPADDGSSDFVW